MLTSQDLTAIKSLIKPLASKMDKLDEKVSSNRKASEREYKKLQAGINLIVDDLGEDVWVLKRKMEKVQEYIGLAAA